MFEHRFGLFENMQVGDLEEHLHKSSGFLVDKKRITQTSKGIELLCLWDQNVSTSKNLCSVLESTQRQSPTTLADSTKLETVNESKPTLNLNHDPIENCSQWVMSNNESALKSGVQLDRKEDEPLKKLLYEFDNRYCFFLISGKATPQDKFNGVANIPWLKVFDFDTDSRKEGLLSLIYDYWKSTRSFTISHGANVSSAKPLLNDSTDWYFPLGDSTVPATVYKNSPLKWFKEYKSFLEDQFITIADFCALRYTPVFLILWYDSEKENMKYLSWVLSVLDPAFHVEHNTKQIILCVGKDPSVSGLDEIVSTYELEKSTVVMKPETVYKYLADTKVPKRYATNIIRLPRKISNEDTHDGIVDVEDHLWINQYVDVLSLEAQDNIKYRRSKEKDFGEKFLKGDLISWDELASDEFAVERCGKQKVYDCLKKDILEKQESFILRIFHSPGGGGTTFARQLLWDLHTKVPCGVVKPSLSLSVSDISERVRVLNDKTHLPVVLLIDGQSEHEVEQLYEICKYAIVILYVQRCSRKIAENSFNPRSKICRIPGAITSPEAEKLSRLFSSLSPENTDRNKKFAALAEDVRKKERRHLFEYGLIAFSHKFKGLQKYVKGYLNLLEGKEGIENLRDWQKVVAYLSLAQYYGQSGLHCQTFHKLLAGHANKAFVSLADVNYSGRQFIIENDHEWKINYYMVAKEILEQILSQAADFDNLNQDHLSVTAKKNLHILVKDFIQMIETSANKNTPKAAVQLLTDMIIKRDNTEVDMRDGVQKKGSLSKLLEDIPDKENRVKILQELVKAFPRKAEFHAHLGRLLNILKKFREAENSLQKALDIRMKEIARIGSDSTDNMLGRIHHMFGIGYTTQAKAELECVLKPDSAYGYKNLLIHVKKAIGHFSKVRQYATRSLSYGYIGEVHARLLVAEYVAKKFEGGCVRAFNKRPSENPDDIPLFEFVRESHSVCDRLLAECLHYTPEQELERISDYGKNLRRFNEFYGKVTKDLPLWQNRDSDVLLRRSFFACCKRSDLRKEDMQAIIQKHERTMREVLKENLYKANISLDMLEWLEAIRHPLTEDIYKLTDIQPRVKNWEQRNEFGYATFYLYAINFLLAIFSSGKYLVDGFYSKARELKDKLQAQRYTRPKAWRREWIACHRDVTIRKLIASKDVGTWDKEKRFWKSDEDVKKLEVFTGTVVRSNHPLRGSIALDVTHNDCGIEVYFVPKKYGLDKNLYGNQNLRVEFCLCLSSLHGAEAFSIKPLKRCVCSFCNKTAEFITINAGDGKCRVCGNEIKKD